MPFRRAYLLQIVAACFYDKNTRWISAGTVELVGKSVAECGMMKRWTPSQIWIVLLLALLAFGLRVYNLDGPSLWLDEGLTPLRSGYSAPEIVSNRITIQEGTGQDTHPPLYFLLIHATRALFGTSDFAFRYPSVLAGILLIPLLYQFGRRLYSPAAGILAALLAALNPLQIWYAQEARMYTLVVLLGAIAAYLLWRAWQGAPLLRSFLLFALFAGLAFLTHYTAAFLIAGLLPFWLWLLWAHDRRDLLLAGGLLAALVMVPLVPQLLPRLFTGAETGYRYVSPLVMLADVARGFSLGLTADASRLPMTILLTVLTLIAVAGIVGPRPWPSGRRARLFLLAYLLATVAGLALVSLLKPMYLGVRHIMIGSPAYILLLALGLLALPRRAWVGPTLALGLIVVGSGLSLFNLYNDPAFARDDVRALVRHIEKHADPGDLVLYNNPILLPLHEHYRQREALLVEALPVYPHPASDDTLRRLTQLAATHERIWFVADPPTDRSQDPQGRVRGWLDAHLLAVDQYNAPARGMRAEVVVYDSRPPAAEALPSAAEAVSLKMEEFPPLRGWQVSGRGPLSLWLDLFWAGSAPPADTLLRFGLQGANGEYWVNITLPATPPRAPAPLAAPLVRLRYGLPLPPGMPPGSYQLRLLPPTGDGRTWRTVGGITLEAPAVTTFMARDPFAAVHFGNGLSLLAVESQPAVRYPGYTVPLTLFWKVRGRGPSAETAFEVELVGPDGRVWAGESSRPGPDWLKAPDWPRDDAVRESLSLVVPSHAPPGTYALRWRLWEGDTAVSARPAWRPWSSTRARLGTVEMHDWPLQVAQSAPEQFVEADFGHGIHLYGYDLEGARRVDAEENGDRRGVLTEGGERLALSLYWRATAVPDRDYDVVIELVDETEEVVVRRQSIPVDGLRMTGGWRAREVLKDSYEMALPAELPAGRYRLYVSLLNTDTGTRLPLVAEGTAQPDDRFLLQTLSIR
ncbi:MAG: glycosyltransferase family 39 protein [Candidatus Promineifilaceae bacterium]|nr:glycosyltransferase family 39 protein [Candidatus Promineifilaceae bacterium]